ncbi:hypothetical protein RHGRI_002967 [Rhododendron griersonianum]|uniref:Ribosomal protein L21 n=1 Tax=Rhododendron griersonianum TaxID=479676 RepID=A0AAV6LRW1_9ERIC|nr:hypothetical protein RHGRI_002967 [Rhododendron griersonianum]
MPAGHSLRSRTRDLFSRLFRKKGTIHLSTYLRTYNIGDYVDIKLNGAVHEGMPHKFYHGRTEAKGRGEIISTKKQPEGPKPGFMVEGATLETVTPNRIMLSMILRVATRLTYVFLSFGYVL